jgi:chromate transporter
MKNDSTSLRDVEPKGTGDARVCLSLFTTFFKIGAFTFGGGFAMIPLIEREMIDRRGWIARGDFLELLALAQSAPGPIALNSAVFVGYKIAGYRGAFAAVAGVVLPSFVIILLIAIYFTDIRHNRYVEAAFKGMRPAVVALIAAPLLNLARGMRWWKRRRGRPRRMAARRIPRMVHHRRRGGRHPAGPLRQTRRAQRKGGNTMIYLQLLLSYLKIGFFGFGGGYAMLSLIQNEIVVQREWLTAEQLTDIIAISQVTPGPIAINSATYVGYAVTGTVWGAALATLAACIPSLTLMLAATKFYLRLRSNRYMAGAMEGMKPMMIGMILAAALLLLTPDTFIDWKSWAILAAAFLASVKKANPILIIVLSAVAGLLLYL